MTEHTLLVLVALNLILLALLLGMFSAWQKMKKNLFQLQQAQRKERETNKKAILQLLDEIVDLAEGHSKTPCSISKHGLTGPIADAVNYLMEQEYPQAFQRQAK